MKTRPVLIVQGGQWGSESKGSIALALCEKLKVDFACRTGSINAGHSIVQNGVKTAFQQIPVGAVLPSVKVVIGPGAYVSPDLLDRELGVADCRDRTYVDQQCGVHLESFTDEARIAGRNLKIGATGKGCAEAVIAKLRDRGVGTPLLLRNYWSPRPGAPAFTDTAAMLNDAYDQGALIMLEGTQGTLLDLHCGPYPFVTSRQCTASAWVTEAGLSPALDYEVVLVVRTYPIRVAGTSGPMGRETDWPTLARSMNYRLSKFGYPPIVRPEAIRDYERALEDVIAEWKGMDPAEIKLKASTKAMEVMPPASLAEVMKLFETTTVTKRLRRIAELDVGLFKATVRKERPAYCVVTFVNYLFPEITYTRELEGDSLAYVKSLEQVIGCLIKYVNIGPRSEDVLEVPAGGGH